MISLRHTCYFPLFIIFISTSVTALSLDDKTHLLDRLAFGLGSKIAPGIDLDNLDRTESVKALLDSINTTIIVPLPASLVYNPTAISKNWPMSTEALRLTRVAEIQLKNNTRKDLQSWWLQQMDRGQSAVSERIILFWHRFFTTGIYKVPYPVMLWRQHITIRKNAFGSFSELLQEINIDPAMLWYLDNRLNNRKKPNENYARELLELYTLGEGHFSERDVKELARALTGAGVEPQKWTYKFQQNNHDNGLKTILGETSDFKPDQVVPLILKSPHVAKYLVEKLWLEFISPTPNQATIAGISDRFRKDNYNIRTALEGILISDDFWADSNRNTLVTSPIELILRIHSAINYPIIDYKSTVANAKKMGEELFNPPDVAGWPGGDDWITSDYLLERQAYLTQFDSGSIYPLLNASDSFAKQQLK